MHECWHVCSRAIGRKGLAERVAQPTGAAGGAWGEEQQEVELRTTGGRCAMADLGFFFFWENSHELTSMEAIVGCLGAGEIGHFQVQ